MFLTGDEIKAVIAIDPQADDGTAITGDAIDTCGYTHAVILFQTSAATGTPTATACDVKVTNCDTSDGTYTDVTGYTIADQAADKIGKINILLKDCKRYLKVVSDTTFTGGSSPAMVVSGVCLLLNKQVLPVT